VAGVGAAAEPTDVSVTGDISACRLPVVACHLPAHVAGSATILQPSASVLAAPSSVLFSVCRALASNGTKVEYRGAQSRRAVVDHRPNEHGPPVSTLP